MSYGNELRPNLVNDEFENKANEYNRQLNLILDTPVSPESVNSYAELALHDVIGLVGRVISDYQKNQGIEPDEGITAETEALAFSHFELFNINDILDYLASKEDELKSLDSLILSITVSPNVILPPDSSQASFQRGNREEFVAPKTFNRLKTALFVISNEFGIDVHDHDQIKMLEGSVDDGMVRKLPYYCLVIPELNKIVMVCDEEGNATFIFNRQRTSDLNITDEDLALYTKPTIEELFASQPGIGTGLRFSKNFVPRLIKALKTENFKPVDSPDSQNELDEKSGAELLGSYLRPPAPEGILSRNGLARLFKVHTNTVNKAIHKLGEALGEPALYQFKNRPAEGYNQTQQELIRQQLESNRMLVEAAPEGYISINVLSERIGLVVGPIWSVINEFESEIGDIAYYRVGSKSKSAPCVSPDQQQLIIERLQVKNLLAPKPSDGVLSIAGIAKVLGIDHGVVDNAIKALNKELGDTSLYKFGPLVVPGYSATQQEKILNHLVERGLFTKPPEGYLSIKGMANALGVSNKKLAGVISELGDELGDVSDFQFVSINTSGYSTEQQELIISILEKRGLSIPEAPEGYLTLGGMMQALGVKDYKILTKAVENLADILGDAQIYKFHGKPCQAYSPEQQAMIKEHITNTNYFDTPPDGYSALSKVVKSLDVSETAVLHAIARLGNHLGPIAKFRFHDKYTNGYSPEQQAMITEYVKRFRDSRE